MKKTGLLWVLAAVLIVTYLLLQVSFIENYDEKEIQEKSNDLEIEKTLVVTIEESNLSLRKNGFKSLVESTRFWKLDGDNILLKEENLIPGESTRILLTYNKGSNALESQENINKLYEFPYNTYRNEESNELIINGLSKDGTVYIKFNDKLVKVKSNSTYRDIWIENGQFRNIKIKNKGFFDPKKFKLMK